MSKKVRENVNKTINFENEKRKKFFDELKAFFILILIIVLLILGGTYWYKQSSIPRELKEKEYEKNVGSYKTSVYKSDDNRSLYILNEKYIIEYADNILYKIMDMNTTVLYEGEQDYSSVQEDLDGNLYVYNIAEVNSDNMVTLFEVKNKKLKEKAELFVAGVNYSDVLLKKENKSYLLGFSGVGSFVNEDGDDENKNYFYNINGNAYESSKYSFVGDESRTSIESEFITYNEKYFIVKNDLGKYGVIDIENGEIIINPIYDGLYSVKDGNYIAKKGKKTGIINLKLKKLVDFEYDFIDRNDDFYVVSKNDKLAIMDDNFKLITDFNFDYQTNEETGEYKYSICCSNFNTFAAKRINDVYILSINNEELSRDIKYDKHETYIINNNGTYESIKANEFGFLGETNFAYAYLNDKKKYIIYDEQFKEKYEISLNSYDFAEHPEIRLLNGNTLAIKLDSNLYFNYETGEEINKVLDDVYKFDEVMFNYNFNKKKVEVSINNKIIAIYDFDNRKENNYYNIMGENSIYYSNDKYYILVKKDN